MSGSSELSFGQQRKPALDQIEPGTAGRRKVQMKTRPFGQPAMNRSGFVRSVIIQDQMDIEGGRHLGLDGVEKLTKLDGSMSTMQSADHFASLGIESRKQRSRTVALIIVSAPFELARSHGQQRLSAIKGLDLALLVDAQHQSTLRGIEIKTDNVTDFVDKQRIAGKFKRLTAMRLQSESTPDPLHRAATQAASLGHHTATPVGRFLGRRFQSQCHRVFDFSIANRSWRAGARLVKQTVQAFADESATPFTDALLTYLHLFGYPPIRKSCRILNDDPRPLRQRLRRLGTACPLLQSFELRFTQRQFSFGSSRTHRFSPLCTETP